MSIVVKPSSKATGGLDIANAAMGKGVSAGVGSGMVAGGLWGLTCGPFAVLCVPLGAGAGMIVGMSAGAVVGLTGALAEDKASMLRARLNQVLQARSLVELMHNNLNERASRYWVLSSDGAATLVVVQVDDLSLTSTRDEQIRFALRVSVTQPGPDGSAAKATVAKVYEQVSSFSALAVWLDDSSDFIETSLSTASQQIAAQIIADLALR